MGQHIYTLSESLTRTAIQYSTKKSRIILGYVGKGWEQRIVMALDSALNKWVDYVPEHRGVSAVPC